MTVKVRLRRDQYDYVVQHAGSVHTKQLVANQIPMVFRMSVEQRDVLVSLMADRLQLVGFGQEYEPNAEGRLVESIIDALRGAR